MAGHRRGAGPDGTTKPRRRQIRSSFFHERLDRAATDVQQLAAAFDYFRSVASHCPDRAVVMNEMATELVVMAKRLEDRYGT